MNCEAIRENVHCFLDEALHPEAAVEVDRHLRSCEGCRRVYQEYRELKEAVSSRLCLPDPLGEQMWREIQLRSQQTLFSGVVGCWDRVWTFWRDLERPIVWAKLVALPITLVCFISALSYLPKVDLHEWMYAVFGTPRHVTDVGARPVVTLVSVRQSSTELSGLMDTVWKMSYEDSLSLVAEITPEGHAEIDSVLEYPRSRALLEAVDLTLRRSQFAKSHDLNRFVIYSFQKIDVWEEQRGL